MLLLFDRDEFDNHVCVVDYQITDGVVWRVSGEAEGSSQYTGDPMELFRQSLLKFPSSDKDAKEFTVVSWRAAIEPLEFNVVNPPKRRTAMMAAADPSYLEPTSLSVRVRVRWIVHGLKKQQQIGTPAPKANHYSAMNHHNVYATQGLLEVPKEIQEILAATKWSNGQTEVLTELSKYFDLTQTLKCHADCPLDAGATVNLQTYVVHLNDKQGWSINKISEHLEELPINIQMKENAVTV